MFTMERGPPGLSEETSQGARNGIRGGWVAGRHWWGARRGNLVPEKKVKCDVHRQLPTCSAIGLFVKCTMDECFRRIQPLRVHALPFIVTYVLRLEVSCQHAENFVLLEKYFWSVLFCASVCPFRRRVFRRGGHGLFHMVGRRGAGA